MINREVDKEIFETLLKLAITQNHHHELAAIPSEDELSRQYSFSPRFINRIGRLIRKEKHARAIRSFSQYTVKTAAVIAIILALTFGAVMAMPEVRATVFDVIIEWFDTHTSYSFSQNTSPRKEILLWQPSYLPANFHESSMKRAGDITTVVYKNDAENLIYFIYTQANEGYSFAIDNEHAVHSQIKLNGIPADIFKAKTALDSSHVIWQENGFSLHLMSTIPYEELIKMADSISQPTWGNAENL